MNHEATMDVAGLGHGSEALHGAADVPVTETGVADGKLGIWIFLASEVMFFSGLIGSYIVLRYGQPAWPTPSTVLNIPLTALNTFLLICSSVTMVQSLAAAQRDDQVWMKRFLLATILIGTTFVSIQAYEYNKLFYGHEGHPPFRPWTSLFGSTFYTMTGFHGAHVSGGVIWLWCVFLFGALRGKFSSKNYTAIELVGLYWHFVDLVWIILFTIVYLI